LLGLVQRLKDWLDVSPCFGVETNWAGKIGGGAFKSGARCFMAFLR
jgi:hypothetical protein